MAKEHIKLVAQNKKAAHEYFFEEIYEAGLELAGTEVKSLRMGKCSLKESFIRISNGEYRLDGTGSADLDYQDGHWAGKVYAVSDGARDGRLCGTGSRRL